MVIYEWHALEPPAKGVPPYASPVTVNSGGTLAGTGYRSSVTVNAGGTVAPRDSLGALHFSGNEPVLTVVPEAGTLALLGIGSISLLGCTWRGRRLSQKDR